MIFQNGAFAITDKNYGTAFQVENDGQVAVSFANTYLIDGDLFEFVEPGMSKTSD
jgi:hypothetical protein